MKTGESPTFWKLHRWAAGAREKNCEMAFYDIYGIPRRLLRSAIIAREVLTTSQARGLHGMGLAVKKG